MRKFPQYRWAFNSAATKTCSVVFEDLPAIALADPAATKPFRTDAGVNRDLQESLPGLLELGIQIELTGPNPQDFTFTLVVAQSLQPTATQQYVMAADYAWLVKDPTNANVPFTQLDDLVLALGGIYHMSTVRVSEIDVRNINAFKSIVEIKNHTQSKIVRTLLTASTNRRYSGATSVDLFFLETTDSKFQDAEASILAIDLRILAFVVQQRYTEEFFAGGLIVDRTTLRVKTYAYNILQDEIALDKDTPLDTASVARYADTSVVGLFRLPLNEVGAFYGAAVVGRMSEHKSAYDVLDVMRPGNTQSHYLSTANEVNFYGGNFQASAYLYATRMATAMQLSHRDRFAVHPNGSWSVTTTPIFYYSGVVRQPSASNFTVFNDWFDLNSMKQASVDIVSVAAKSKTAAPIRTTHLKLFNRAFGKSLTPADFLCVFTLFTDQLNWTSQGIAGVTVMHYIQAKTPANATLYIQLYGRSSDGIAVPKFHAPVEPLYRADARALNASVFSAPPYLTGFEGNLSNTYRPLQASPKFEPLHDTTAVLNGNTLFY